MGFKEIKLVTIYMDHQVFITEIQIQIKSQKVDFQQDV